MARSAVSLGRYRCRRVTDAHEPWLSDNRPDRETGIALAGDRSHHAKVALDAAWLLARRDHASLNAHAHIEDRAAQRDRRSDQLVFTLTLKQHIGPKPAPIPRSDRCSRQQRYPRPSRVVEGARRTLKRSPLAR